MAVTVHEIGRASVKHAMRPELIIKGRVAGHHDLGVADSLIGMEMGLHIFETSPQPLAEDIVLLSLHPC